MSHTMKTDTSRPPALTPRIAEVRRIWSRAPHNAFTDLARFSGAWYCAFRESERHVGSLGKIRIIASRDGVRWRSELLYSEPGIDLRDPKLSVTPTGRLMLLAGGSAYHRGRYVGRQPRVMFSTNGSYWERASPILDHGDWLWRVTWDEGVAYGITYRITTPTRWTIHLVASADGTHFCSLGRLQVPGRPNEATIRFLPDRTAVALVRREGGDREAWVGESHPPYKDWRWRGTGVQVGGPNFVVLPEGDGWVSGRMMRADGPRTAVGRLAEGRITPLLDLPSGGDCSYPGMIWHNRRLWMSYYSSHEGKSAIYLAKLSFETHTYSAI